ncbi:hypothetical protein LSH36_629g00001 [Paralvinella palmiformis]|uniref:Uncharacterized protein n=1 Tax=Paralvinella palmiformis TaxID=53620 RepID=A0AAD9MUB9_9ANNE|nr:hypothetical protein LSH36_629g00001 [Paralvinella palmiformis]
MTATYDFELLPVGFVINPMGSYLGCSPDRPVYDRSHNEMGLLEVNCTIKESVSGVAYLRLVGEGFQLQRSHQYYEQYMGQMGLTGFMWCDCVVWCENDSHCERLEYGPAVITRMLAKLDVFFV